MKSLVPCPGCARHVRVSEPACPFCQSALPDDLSARAIPATRQRLGRAAAFTFAATLGLAGCSDDPAPTADSGTAADTGTDTGNAPVDTGTPGDTGTPVDTGLVDDTGGPVAAYGAPPDRDAGPVDAAAPPDDGGGAAPAYGLPPPRDAGPPDPDDGGGVAPLYGLPPPRDAGH